jgi:hypothetical protein
VATRHVVIDTCLLVLLVVGMTNRKYIRKHKNLTPVYSAAHFDALQRTLARRRQIATTPHILAETSNLLRQISDPIRSEIMREFQRFIPIIGELGAASATAAKASEFVRLGMTDAAIISLDRDNCEVLTVDHDLHLALSKRGFAVTNMTAYFHEAADDA